ncbi:Uncharacterised protein [Burkholderia pseudomallei]|nr:Uncharacterised protein [Burkholderia pseudomallei]
MENAFNERGVMVTRNGLSAAGQIFALREIRGVEVRTVRKNKLVPCAISLTGAAAAIAGGALGSSALLVAGVMLVVVGYLAWTTQDVTHRLIVEREAIMSVDREFVERVAHAVDAARAAGAST